MLVEELLWEFSGQIFHVALEFPDGPLHPELAVLRHAAPCNLLLGQPVDQDVHVEGHDMSGEGLQ